MPQDVCGDAQRRVLLGRARDRERHGFVYAVHRDALDVVTCRSAAVRTVRGKPGCARRAG